MDATPILGISQNFNLWNHQLDKEQPCTVKTYWFDDESSAKAFFAECAAQPDNKRFFSQPRSCLGPYRVVEYVWGPKIDPDFNDEEE